MKIILPAALALATLSVSGVARAEDRPVTIYAGPTSITIPASVLAPARQPKPQSTAAEAAAPRKIRVVLASPYRTAN